MSSGSNNIKNSTSTPKHSRIQTGVMSKKNLAEENLNLLDSCSSISGQNVEGNNIERCDSPRLPCNQSAYLSDHTYDKTSNNERPLLDYFMNSEGMDDEYWDSFVIKTQENENINLSNSENSSQNVDPVMIKHSAMINDSEKSRAKRIKRENYESFDPITENSVRNRIQFVEENPYPNIVPENTGVYSKDNNESTVTVKLGEMYKLSMEQSFHVLNKSIVKYEKNNKTSLFDTSDSCFVDLKEYASGRIEISEGVNHTPRSVDANQELIKSLNNMHPRSIEIHKLLGLTHSMEATELDSIVSANPSEPMQPTKVQEVKDEDFKNFYGLPLITKSLFKAYRNIEKFYDWQEECLNLSAIKEKRNLIYALPTSGGKTLVAEVLILREILCYKKNALLILPFVAIVQEKIWSLSPFAVALDFLIEEYAAGKGHIPPKKRRTKNSIYIATIEKGLALVRSLLELKRLDEIGLIVVDELHLIGEKGRGGTLETLLTIVKFTNPNIQIVGMSATIGNIDEIAQWLGAEVFQREFRPVELEEFVKMGGAIYRITWRDKQLQLDLERTPSYNYSRAATRMDPDQLGGLVAEVVPGGGVLVFCPTKRNCASVARLLADMARRDMAEHRVEERRALATALQEEGAAADLVRAVTRGVAYHHAGLTSDERTLLEAAFRAGVVSVLCCTSTLAAGVNLPARRVIVRAPLVGRAPLSLAAYRQMSGRAGRAGVCQTGESILMCKEEEWAQVRGTLQGGVVRARSQLAGAARDLVLGAVALRAAPGRAALRRLLRASLLAHQRAGAHDGETYVESVCEESVQALVESGMLEAAPAPAPAPDADADAEELRVSELGRAAIKGCMDISTAKQLQVDLEAASRGVVLLGNLHLLYLVTPHDGAGVSVDYRHYYSLYCNLDEEELQTARKLGIDEMNAIRMMTGKPITNVAELVLRRFYLAMALNDVWRQKPIRDVADKYCVSMGAVQSLMTSSATFASGAHRFCEELEQYWPFAALLKDLATRLQYCVAPELQQLMELPNVRKVRALQLCRAGFRRVRDVARAQPPTLAAAAPPLSVAGAAHLVTAARMMLIEKMENLRAEAEEVMEELNM